MEKQKGLAIITGASQGIGAVIAAGLAKDGYRVVLIARNRQNLEKVHDEIMLSDKMYKNLLYCHWTSQTVQR